MTVLLQIGELLQKYVVCDTIDGLIGLNVTTLDCLMIIGLAVGHWRGAIVIGRFLLESTRRY